MRFFIITCLLFLFIQKIYTQPRIDSFSPSSAKQGETVVIRGVNFLDVTGVYFEGIPALSYQVISSSEIRATIAGGATGMVSVWTKEGLSQKYGFIYSGNPAFYWLSNTWGLPPILTYSGKGFQNIQSVTVGGQSLLSAYAYGAWVLNLTNPIRGDFIVQTPAGTVIHPFIGHTFVHHVDYLSGLPGDTIIVHGYNLNLVSDAFIGAYKMTKIYSDNEPVRLRYVIPQAPMNFSAPMTFITQHQVIQSFEFAIRVSPRIYEIWPREAIAGDTISIYGKGFDQATSVKIGGAESNFKIINDNELKVQVGGNASSGTIIVATSTGKGRKDGFVRTPIKITHAQPNPVGYGDILNISGTRFGNVKEVLLGSNPQKSLPFKQIDPQYISVPIWEEIQAPIIIRNEFESSAPFTNLSFIRKPYIDSVVPSKAKPGEQITLFVKNVSNPWQISFSGVSGTIVSFDGTRLVATVADGYKGPVYLNCSEGTAAFNKFTLVKKPEIHNFKPLSGGFGDTITVTGKEFDLINKVYLGDVPLNNFWISPSYDTIKIALNGNLLQGTFKIALKDRVDSSVSYNAFNFFFPPTLSNDKIKLGSAGSLVQLKGKNLFGYSHYPAVLFDNIPSPKLHVLSDSILYAEVPEGIQPSEIKVHTAYGLSQSVPFIYKAPPVIDTLFPTYATAGETVTILGKNFSQLPGYDVRLFMNTLKLTPEVISDNEVRFIMPEYASSGRVTIQTNGYSIESRHMIERVFDGSNDLSLKQFSNYTFRNNNTEQIKMSFVDLDGDNKPEWIRFTKGENYRYKLTWQKNLSDLYNFQFGPEVILFDSVANCCLTIELDAGDINNDGKPDIIMTIGPNAGSTGIPTALKIFYNEFLQRQLSFRKVEDNISRRYLSPLITDLDKDGFPDFVYFGVDNQFGGSSVGPAYWWFSYAYREEYPFYRQEKTWLGSVNNNGNYGYSGPVKIEYINPDARPDVLIPWVSQNMSTSVKKPYNLGFTPINTTINLVDFDSHLRDLNGDGLTDIIRFMGPNAIVVYKNTGNTEAEDGLFEQQSTFPPAVSPMYIRANDFNGDQKVDFVFFGKNLYESKTNADSICFFKRVGTSDQFNFEPHTEPTHFNFHTDGVFTGDYNADGRPDLLLLQSGVSGNVFKEIKFLINTSTSGFHSSGCLTEPRTLTTLATGKKYQWQMLQSGKFENINETEPFSGTNSRNLLVGSMSSTILSTKFRCLVDNVATPEYTIRVRNEFVGVASGNRLWSDAANWSCGIIPDLNMDAILDGLEVIIDQPASCRHLILKNNGKVLLENGSSLNIRD